MARLHTSGFEIRDHNTVLAEASPDGLMVGTNATVSDTTVFRSGLASVKCQGTSTLTSYRRFNFTAPPAGTGLYGRVYVRMSALPNATKKILRFAAGATQIASVRLTSGGNLQLFNDVAGTQVGSNSADALTTDLWYRIELYTKIGTGSVDELGLRLTLPSAPYPFTATTVASTTGAGITDTIPTDFECGWLEAPGVTSNMFLDDLAVNDSTGTKQNSWADEGRVAYLPPRVVVSAPFIDNTCTGATSNTEILAALNTVPSVSHADTTAHSTSHQIRSSTNVSATIITIDCSTYVGAGISGNVLLTVVGSSTTGRIGSSTIDTSNVYGQKVATKFTTAGTLDYVEVYLNKLGSPTDNVIFELQTDSAGAPSGTVLSSVTLDATTVGTSSSWHKLLFAPQPLTYGTVYWIVASRSGSLSDTDVVRWDQAFGTYIDGGVQVHNGTNWVAASGGRSLRIFASDGTAVIKTVQPVVCHGEAIATGTKSGALSLSANPSAAAVTFDYGDNIGAAGTYPTSWRWKRGTTVYDLSITNFGLSPRLVLTKTDGTTRVALISTAGVIVDYVAPPQPGWLQYTKTSDSSLWWAKQAISTTTASTIGGLTVEALAGDWLIYPNPAIADGDDLPDTLTTITTATLEAGYTLV